MKNTVKEGCVEIREKDGRLKSITHIESTVNMYKDGTGGRPDTSDGEALATAYLEMKRRAVALTQALGHVLLTNDQNNEAIETLKKEGVK